MIDWEGGDWHWCTSAACVVGWSDHWQTMITGVLAVLAAIWATGLSWSRERREHAARLRAARASLAATLSAVCSYAEAVGRELARVYPEGEGLFDAATAIPAPPVFPEDRIASLERVMELKGSSSDISARIGALLLEAQVLDARTRNFATSGEADRSMLGSCIIQATVIYAQAESLFEFARGQRDGVAAEPMWNRVFAAFSVFGLHAHRFEQVKASAQRTRDRGEEPGEANEPAPY